MADDFQDVEYGAPKRAKHDLSDKFCTVQELIDMLKTLSKDNLVRCKRGNLLITTAGNEYVAVIDFSDGSIVM